MADHDEIRSRLIRLIEQRGKRRTEWTKERPTEWRPSEVFDPEFGVFMTDPRAWEFIRERLEAGSCLESIALDSSFPEITPVHG